MMGSPPSTRGATSIRTERMTMQAGMQEAAGNPGETYNYRVVRQFAIMTVVWGVVGMLVGVIIAAQLAWPELLPSV